MTPPTQDQLRRTPHLSDVTCTITAPRDLASRIKKRIAANIGLSITCSIGFAANRMLAKSACNVDKPNGDLAAGG